MIMDYSAERRYIDDKQGPADGVTPVLTPANPSKFKSLLVFFHIAFLSCP